MPQERFYSRLNEVFIPATVLMQIDAGLCAYIPTVTAGLDGKPTSVPDETAILFWETEATYSTAFDTLAVRTYTLTHGAVYTPASGAAFPGFFAGALPPNEPRHLSKEPADWMVGAVHHLLGSRPASVSPQQFRKAVSEVLTGAQQRGVAGAIACAGDDYLVYWELGTAGAASPTVAELAPLLAWHHTVIATDTSLPVGLWDAWPGLAVAPGDSLNLIFRRRARDRN